MGGDDMTKRNPAHPAFWFCLALMVLMVTYAAAKFEENSHRSVPALKPGEAYARVIEKPHTYDKFIEDERLDEPFLKAIPEQYDSADRESLNLIIGDGGQ